MREQLYQFHCCWHAAHVHALGTFLILDLVAFKHNGQQSGRKARVDGHTFPWGHSLHPPSVPTGVITYAIGVAWAAQDELDIVATHPARDHAFFVDEFDNLYKVVPKVIQNICTEFNSQPRN